MRISDWSSDVCSSDLPTLPIPPALRGRSQLARNSHLSDNTPDSGDTAAKRVRKPRATKAAKAPATPDAPAAPTPAPTDRKRVVEGKSVSVRVDHGGRCFSTNIQHTRKNTHNAQY